MKIKRLRILCLVLILPWIVGFGEVNHAAISVSLINLIATPDKYHDKTVRVVGVANIAFEGNGIYLSKEHWANFVVKNAIWITPNYKAIGKTEKELSKFNGRYVVIEGIFNKNDYGHMGLYSGSIDDVRRFQPMPPDILKDKRKTG